MTLEQAIDRYTNNAEYERRNGSLHGCMEFRQLAEWLKDYKRLLEQQPVTPQQKYGKWILADEQNKEDVENDNYRFICSECQCSDIHAKGTIVPYCWKCGAKMQESENKNERQSHKRW